MLCYRKGHCTRSGGPNSDYTERLPCSPSIGRFPSIGERDRAIDRSIGGDFQRIPTDRTLLFNYCFSYYLSNHYVGNN